MSISQIKEHAKTLRLTYILNNIDEEIENNKESFEGFLAELLSREVHLRKENSKIIRLKNACFPYKKYLDEIDEKRLPREAKEKFEELKKLDFINKAQNIVAFGNPGTGKTHLSIALGIEAANAGFTVKYYSVPTLINRLKELKKEKNLLSIQKHFETVDLMILDELGYISFDKEGGELLFTHLSMRAERKSTIITTNLTFDKWKTVFNDPILTTAIIDRITHNSFVLNMIGETNRKKLK